MKRYCLFIAMIGLLMCSCAEKTPDNDPAPGVVTLKSVANTYCIGDNWKARRSFNIPKSIELFLVADKECHSPEFDPNGESELFLAIAERNADRSFTYQVSLDPNMETSGFDPIYHNYCADNFKSLRVVCTDNSWDARHAPGDDLGDVMRVQYVSAAPFIRNGYKNLESENLYWKYGSYLSHLTERDLAVIRPSMDIMFDALPEKGSYRLEITLTTTEDVKIVVPYTVVVD